MKKGDTLVCTECGVAVTVCDECGCAEHELFCCGKPMKTRSAKPAKKTKKR